MVVLYVFLGIAAFVALIAIIVVIANKHNRDKYHIEKPGEKFDFQPRTFIPKEKHPVESGVSKDITEIRGEQGEAEVFEYLEEYVIGQDDTLLPTLLLETYNGVQTEVDMVLLSVKGVFCIEVKNWVGEIKGDDFDEKWIQIYDDDIPNRSHPNPVMQNENHCEILGNLIGNQYKIFNIVLFKELEYPNSIHSDKVFDLCSFKEYFSSLPNNILTNDDLDEIYDALEEFEADDEKLRIYRQSVKNKYHN